MKNHILPTHIARLQQTGPSRALITKIDFSLIDLSWSTLVKLYQVYVKATYDRALAQQRERGRERDWDREREGRKKRERLS